MKRKFNIAGKILCFSLVLLMAVQTASLAVAGAGADLIGPSSIELSAQNDVLPDTDNGKWEIPLAEENPNQVDMTINNGIVYNDHVYEKLIRWNYTDGYKSATDPYSGYWRDFTASLGPIVGLSNYSWVGGVNGNWIDNKYITTAVKRRNGEYGIYKNIITPTLTLGGRLNIDMGYINLEDMETLTNASKANPEQANLRITATGDPGTNITFMGYDSAYATPLYVFNPNGAGKINAEINLMDYYNEDKYSDYPTVKFHVEKYGSLLSGINVVFIDNTSPSIQNIDVSQEGDQIVVKLKTNEGVRWSSDMAKEDLDDIWIEVDLQVVGTDYTQTVRAHVAGIDYRHKTGSNLSSADYSNDIVFKGDLGVFADLDYKVIDISGVNVPKKDYPITFGKMLMIANQTRDHRVRNETLGKWDSENQVTVYETYNTTAICDLAGNPINLESVVNWPINQKEIKNAATFVRKIELINEKILLGRDMSQADGFMEDISRAEYFFGPDDEIAPRLFINRVLSDEEIATFRVKTSMKDENGEFIWLSQSGTGRYSIGLEEFMYIDFEPLVLTREMTPIFQDGKLGYFEILEVECELDESHPFTESIPGPEKSLYIDLYSPEVTAKSLSLEEPDAEGGYYKLDIELSIKDKAIDSTLQSGVLEQDAYFYLSGDVNEKTPIRYLVDTNASAPQTVEGYSGTADLVPDGKIKLGDKAVGMTTDGWNKVYVHLLIPEKANLLVKGFTVYADVSDTVGNNTHTGLDIEWQYYWRNSRRYVLGLDVCRYSLGARKLPP